MTRNELIREYFVEEKYDMLVCEQCMCELWSRGEKFTRTDGAVVDINDLEQFFEDGECAEAEDGDEPCGCEWCGGVDDLYGIWLK